MKPGHESLTALFNAMPGARPTEEWAAVPAIKSAVRQADQRSLADHLTRTAQPGSQVPHRHDDITYDTTRLFQTSFYLRGPFSAQKRRYFVKRAILFTDNSAEFTQMAVAEKRGDEPLRVETSGPDHRAGGNDASEGLGQKLASIEASGTDSSATEKTASDELRRQNVREKFEQWKRDATRAIESGRKAPSLTVPLVDKDGKSVRIYNKGVVDHDLYVEIEECAKERGLAIRSGWNSAHTVPVLEIVSGNTGDPPRD